MTDLRLAQVRHFLPGRIQPQRALAAIEDDGRAIGELERARLDAGERGNSQRAREDRHVRGRAATHRAKPITLPRSIAAVSDGVRSSAMRTALAG